MRFEQAFKSRLKAHFHIITRLSAKEKYLFLCEKVWYDKFKLRDVRRK
jgi:hypothetical protein